MVRGNQTASKTVFRGFESCWGHMNDIGAELKRREQILINLTKKNDEALLIEKKLQYLSKLDEKAVNMLSIVGMQEVFRSKAETSIDDSDFEKRLTEAVRPEFLKLKLEYTQKLQDNLAAIHTELKEKMSNG